MDRWPDPCAVLVNAAGNYTLLGEVRALSPADLAHIAGFVEASEGWASLLKAAFPEVKEWKRVILEQRACPSFAPPGAYPVRRLEPSDAYHLWGLSPQVDWIGETWGGMPGLASSGFAWGAFVEGRLASVACPFLVGETYEDIGVVTEPRFRRLGLGTACARALCGDIRAREHRPSWSTSPDNMASVRVAEKLGFVVQRYDLLYAVGVEIPEPAHPSAS